jgi:hypothetical protein
MNSTNELVKWKPPVSDAGRKIDAALERLRNGVRRAEASPLRKEEIAPEVVDLQRVCAVHDKPYAARYVRGRDGRYRYAQSIRVTESLYRAQYAESERLSVDTGFAGEETCAWCGASGFAAVRCTGCGTDVCYGKTVARYFRCRRSCGHEGKLVSGSFRHLGMRPFVEVEGTRSGG